MKRFNSILMLLLIVLIMPFQTSCSDDDEGGDITVFAGTYTGIYRALFFDTEKDTVVVTVDEANNKVTFTSAILRTSFETEYNPSTERAEIENLTIDTLKFVQGQSVNYAYNTTVSGGYCEMRNNNTDLYIRLNNANVSDHTFDPPVPDELTIPTVETPNNMKPL